MTEPIMKRKILNLQEINMSTQSLLWMACLILAVLAIFLPIPGGAIVWAALAIAVK